MLPQLLKTTFYCAKCGSLTHVNQWKVRSAWSIDEAITEVPQLQVLCTNPECKKTHVIIPDFLNPYKRYIGKEIETVIENKSANTAAEESTKRRWKKQFAQHLPEILNALIRLLIIEYENMLSLLDCSGELNRLRTLLVLFPGRKSATALGRANMELFLGGLRLYF